MARIIPLGERPSFSRRRLMLGAPQWVIAAQVGISPNFYQHVDSGYVKPSKRVLREVERVLSEMEAAAQANAKAGRP